MTQSSSRALPKAPTAAVIGAGAIGGWLADALCHAGWRVSVVARGETLSALRGQGLIVHHAGGPRYSHPRVGAPADFGPQEYVLLAVKAHSMSTLAPEMMPLFGPQTVVVSTSNGIPWWFLQDFGGPLADRLLKSVDPDGAQARVFPRERILGSVVHASARATSPGQVTIIAADRMFLGRPSGAEGNQQAALIDALRAGGINAVATTRIRHEVWAKLWGNMNMNPLSALTRSSTGTLLGDPAICELTLNMMEEMQACARLLDLEMSITANERLAITRRLGDFKTSMLLDCEAGRELEYAPLLGAVVEIAELLAVPAPFCRSVLALTRLLSAAGRRPQNSA